MPITEIRVRRFSLVSSRPFEDVVLKLSANIGRPDIDEFQRDIAATRTAADLEALVQGAIGSSGLIEFFRFDMGQILRKEGRSRGAKILRLVVGNPLIMKQMAETVPDAASYAPVTILVDERVDGVHLSYDSMASYLLPYGNLSALKVAGELDAKVKALLTAAAG